MEKIELTENTKYAIEGYIVTMDEQFRELKSSVIYINGDTIVDVKKSTESPPPGFTKQMIIKTGGTIYPGLIELHNHLSYNILPMWMVPKQFEDRDQWRRHGEYKQKMTGPLKVLGHTDGYLQAIVRYVECKLLFSGVTSSQGISLASHQNIKKYYKGVVRNVEQTVDPDLPDAKTRIADIESAQKLLKRLETSTCYLLHLAEGIHSRANKHFRALQISSNKWAINDALVGIHSVGLLPDDFKIMKKYEGSVVWSPMSNFLLYGITLDIVSAKQNELLIGLGSDWSASGSKNLLCELKVAKLVSDELGNVFSNKELVSMVTSNAAKILKWDETIGSIQSGKKADLLVLNGKKGGAGGDAYKKLIDAKEQNISFVIIDGWPRIGYKRLMDKFNIKSEKVQIGTSVRYIYLNNEADNPIEIDISFKGAKKLLKQGMKNLKQLAAGVETGSGIFAGAVDHSNKKTKWFIESDHEDRPESSQRHHLEYENEKTGGDYLLEAAEPLSDILGSMELDESNIADDRPFFKNLAVQKNLPEYIKLNLPTYYGQTIDLSDIDKFVKNIPQDVQSNFNFVQSLSRFYDTPGYLSLKDRLTICDQARVIIEHTYVHRYLKRAMHASNPLEQLRILKEKVQSEDEYISEISFHKEIIKIFNSLRDLHTTYQLPAPFNDKVAFVPFYIEEFFEGGKTKYIVSKIIGESPSSEFKKGVEVLSWNNVPIERAIELNGNRYAGSNPAARHARGFDSMTFRPLAVMLPPEEDFVTVQYLTTEGFKRRLTFPWMVGSIYAKSISKIERSDYQDFQVSAGYDFLTREIQSIKKKFFAYRSVKSDDLSQSRAKAILPSGNSEKTTFPGHFKARTVTYKGETFSYIRIYSFSTNEPKKFVQELDRLIKTMRQRRIIIDVRSNGGGNILAAEWALQVLSTKTIKPEPAQFINSKFTEQLSRNHSPSELIPELDLSRWYKSFRQIGHTGALYSLGFPITKTSTLKSFRSKRKYKLLLITDALCYSATDIFAAGFQDHDLGKIIGIHKNTGAGGANVWSHTLLHYLSQNLDYEYFTPLPYRSNLRVAIRRTLRVHKNAGIPLEDLGVKPDEYYQMSKNDLLNKNKDLINRACELLI